MRVGVSVKGLLFLHHDPEHFRCIVLELVSCVDGVPGKKMRRERLQDKAMCSPCDEEYLSWKKRIIEQAETALNNSHRRKSKT